MLFSWSSIKPVDPVDTDKDLYSLTADDLNGDTEITLYHFGGAEGLPSFDPDSLRIIVQVNRLFKFTFRRCS